MDLRGRASLRAGRYQLESFQSKHSRFYEEGVNGYFLLGTRITLQVLHLGLNKIALFSFEKECRCQRSSSHKCVRK